MKIVICGSVNFPEKIREIEKGLKDRGHEVVVPYSIIKHRLKSYDDALKLKESEEHIKTEKPELTRRHFDEIKNADAILAVNVEKHGIKNYIGGATFSEIMLAFYYKKKIFFLNPIPTDERLSFIFDELAAVKPVTVGDNFSLVK